MYWYFYLYLDLTFPSLTLRAGRFFAPLSGWARQWSTLQIACWSFLRLDFQERLLLSKKFKKINNFIINLNLKAYLSISFTGVLITRIAISRHLTRITSRLSTSSTWPSVYSVAALITSLTGHSWVVIAWDGMSTAVSVITTIGHLSVVSRISTATPTSVGNWVAAYQQRGRSTGTSAVPRFIRSTGQNSHAVGQWLVRWDEWGRGGWWGCLLLTSRLITAAGVEWIRVMMRKGGRKLL